MPTALNAMNNLQLKNAGSKHHITLAAQVCGMESVDNSLHSLNHISFNILSAYIGYTSSKHFVILHFKLITTLQI